MAIIPPSAEKHDLSGIGSASAASILAVLSANPSTSFLTVGFLGKVVFFFAEKIFTGLASMGLVILNVGAEKLSAAIDKSNYDGSMRSAFEFIEEIRKTGRELTSEETKKIDDEVITQFRKFAKMTRSRK